MKRKLFCMGLVFTLMFSLLPTVSAQEFWSAEDNILHYSQAPAAEPAAEENSDLIQLGTPTELTWGRSWEYLDWDAEKQEDIYEWVDAPGFISWKTAAPDQNQPYIRVYRQGEDEIYDSYYWDMSSLSHQKYYSIDSFTLRDPESGTYYFTVTSCGDGVSYRDSETAVSDTWTYVKPQAQLPACNNLSWTEGKVEEYEENYYPNGKIVCTFNAPVDEEYFGGIEVDYYFSEAAGGEPDLVSTYWYHGSYISDFNLYDDVIQNNGVGYYYFKVRALSSDITKACNGPWSELSPAYNLTKVVGTVSSELDNIIQSDIPVEEKVDAVQNMDSQKLKNAMLADGGVVDQLAQLENELMGPAEISVSQEAAAFAPEKIGVVGANLNLEAGATEGATLVVDKPERDHVIDEAFDNSVAVRFSMSLDNVTDPSALEVPVQITLPIPETINPGYLVVLHYHADGSYEELWPYIFADDQGQLYAQFVLTSFSDFVMTQWIPDDQPSFTDLQPGAFYTDAVSWAVAYDITSGTSATTFSPMKNCTRADVVTFLWRANGSPAPKSANNPFTDVENGQYYTDAVLWAVEQGITKGIDVGKFGTLNPVTRGQFVTFLWRAKGCPEGSQNNPFTDVGNGQFYTQAILWAYGNGITDGVTATTFEPERPCTRGQVVTFLYRAYA